MLRSHRPKGGGGGGVGWACCTVGVAAANDLRSAPRQFHNGHVCKQWPKSGRGHARTSKWECAKLSAAILSAGGSRKTHKQKKARKNYRILLRLKDTQYLINYIWDPKQ